MISQFYYNTVGTVKHSRMGTALTLAPQPLQILCATLCLSIHQPKTSNKA